MGVSGRRRQRAAAAGRSTRVAAPAACHAIIMAGRPHAAGRSGAGLSPWRRLQRAALGAASLRSPIPPTCSETQSRCDGGAPGCVGPPDLLGRAPTGCQPISACGPAPAILLPNCGVRHALPVRWPCLCGAPSAMLDGERRQAGRAAGAWMAGHLARLRAAGLCKSCRINLSATCPDWSCGSAALLMLLPPIWG